jgi:hypothetical protein
MKGVGHALKDFFETDHLAEESFDISVHHMLLASCDGIWAMLKGG